MRWLARFRMRVRRLIGRAALEREMDDEMRVHLELEVEHLMRTEGLARSAARRRAHVAFGGVERYRELGRDARRSRALDDLLRDVRQSARALARSPGFTLPAVLTLGLGIGITTAMFSVVQGALLRPLPFAAPERLVSVWEVRSPDAGDAHAVGARGEVRASLPTYRAWVESQRSVRLAAFAEREYVLTGAEPRVAAGAAVSADFFDLLGTPLHLGRPFLSQEDAPGAAGAIVLGYSLWRSHYGGEPSVLGRTVEVQGRSYEVVGVAAPGFDYPAGAEVWTPLLASFVREAPDHPRLKILRVIGRLAEDATTAGAASELSAIAGAVPDNDGWAASVVPLHAELTSPLRRPLLLLMGAGVLVLLIGSANVGLLLLARGAARRHELSIRAALGAGRLRIVRELFTESVLLSLAGCAVGVLVAYATRGVMLTLSPVALPVLAERPLDGAALGFAVLVALGSAVLAGTAPALRLGGTSLAAGIGESGAQRTPARASTRLRSGLVVGEVALSVVLLAAAGLLLRSFLALVSVDPGFDADEVTVFELRMPQHRYSGWAQPLEVRARLVERIEALPGVAAASITQSVPLTGPAEPTPILVEGRERDPALPVATIAIVAPGFFDAMGIDVVAGRDFEDVDADRAFVAIVNETFARTFFPGEDPIGRKAARMIGGATQREIVGVVADVRQTDLASPPQPIYYTHAAQEGLSALSLVVRSSVAPAALVPAVRGAVREVDAEIATARVATMRDLVGRSVAQPRFYAAVLGLFAALATALSAFGLYSMLAEQAVRRRREMGVRLALGARPSDILLLMLGHGLRLALAGIAIGILAALAATRLMAAMLFGVAPGDSRTYAAVALLLLGAAALAALLPALRIARIDPVRSIAS